MNLDPLPFIEYPQPEHFAAFNKQQEMFMEILRRLGRARDKFNAKAETITDRNARAVARAASRACDCAWDRVFRIRNKSWAGHDVELNRWLGPLGYQTLVKRQIRKDPNE